MTRHTNQSGIDLIKKYEGLRTDAYRDAAGIWTIGYGHTDGVQQGQHVSEAEAEALLRQDVRHAEAAVERLVKVPLNDNQFAALVAFTFNLGAASLAASTLLRKLNQGDYASVPAEMERWSKVRDPLSGEYQVLSGLLKRRQAEGRLFAASADFDDDTALPASEQTTAMDVPLVPEEFRYIRFAVTARSGLKLRDAPSPYASVIDVLAYGTMLYIGQHRGSWVAVDLDGDGNVNGWVAENYLEPVVR